MAFVYTQIDGQRVEDSVAAAFRNLAAAFQAKFGLTLHVRSGTRTRAEQEYLYHLYITGQGSLAAKPGTSNHEEYGPTGPRALDVYDSGADAGVTRAGTVRANWLKANAPAYGFDPAGYRFSMVEPWHIEFTGNLDDSGSPAGGTGDWSETKKQEFLVSIGLDTGGVGNGWGPRSEAATRTFQTLVGLESDGKFGPLTTGVAKTIEAGGNRSGRQVIEIQQKLQEKGINPGPIDNVWGNKTGLATYIFQGLVGLTKDSLYGPETDAKLFEVVETSKYPTDGKNWIPEKRSTTDIQLKLILKGYDLGLSGADGDYGPKTSVAVAQFQDEQEDLTVDGDYGDLTDARLFPATTTPPPADTGDETSHTPDIVDLVAADFPGWIRYEEKFDKQYLAAASTWNTGLFKYYGVEYDPIEWHLHWWNVPGQGGTHDGNTTYLNETKDVGANGVLSPGRFTKTMPFNKIALTTGRRNPYAVKLECDPLITTEQGDLGYRTLGFVIFKLEQKNPKLQGALLRHHKEFYATSCSEIDLVKARAYAEKFRTGALDPNTGLPPVVVVPDPEPEEPTLKDKIEAKHAELGELISQLED